MRVSRCCTLALRAATRWLRATQRLPALLCSAAMPIFDLPAYRGACGTVGAARRKRSRLSGSAFMTLRAMVDVWAVLLR